MAQCTVQLVSTDDLDKTITISINGTRIEYFLGDRYRQTLSSLRGWLESQWTNYAVAQLTCRAISIIAHVNRVKEQKKMSTSIEHKTGPSEEYSWTVIAPTARGITYNGERAWFKTQQDAEAFAASIYEGETRKNFDLAIVQCKNVVAPKPQIELSSRWNTSTAA